MSIFTLQKNKPSPYCTVTLSDGSTAYESNGPIFWRTLKQFCTDNNLTVCNVTIIRNNGDKLPIKRNHPKYYFIVREGKIVIQGDCSVKKGYGVVCLHPGNIKRTYIEWYNENGTHAHREVLRDTRTFYEKEIGIPAS